MTDRERAAALADDLSLWCNENTAPQDLDLIIEALRTFAAEPPAAAVNIAEYIGDQPRRRVVFLGHISADDWDGLQNEFRHLATEIARHGRLSTRSVSGGYSIGHIYVTSEDGSIDHDSWAAKLDNYLKKITAADQKCEG